MILLNRNLNANYHVYDLKTSYPLIRKFLDCFGYSVNFNELEYSDSLINNGLVISNGAISEMRGSLLDDYIDTVVSKARYGYFMTNFESHSAPYGGMTTSQFISRLRDAGKTDVVELNAAKFLSYFDFQAGTRLIVFGAKIPEFNFQANFIEGIKIRLLGKFYRINEILTNYIIK